MLIKEALAAFIREGGVDYRENSVSFILNCPKCNKRKVYIHKEYGYFVCWVCREKEDYHGKAEFALADIYGAPIWEIKKKIYDNTFQFENVLNLELKDLWGDSEEEFLNKIEELPIVPWDPYFVSLGHPRFEKGQIYLENRGIKIEHIMEYDIHYDPRAKRVIFPIKVNGDLLGWQGRYIDKLEIKHHSTGTTFKVPKYVTSFGMKKDRVLMFQDRLKGSPHAVLAEGPTSALGAHLCGGNVASMGKAVSVRQLEIIKSSVPKLYLALDPDAADEIDSICRKLYGEIEIYGLFPPSGKKDLGECTQEEVFQQFKKAKKLFGDVFMFFRPLPRPVELAQCGF